mmetsp:Transcript_24524/g.58143  ORF Transcript_24524/g.58143 Transcript_24524/m.58143 type:complete len:363 (-) Transcript_24524:1048-2136(-)
MDGISTRSPCRAAAPTGKPPRSPLASASLRVLWCASTGGCGTPRVRHVSALLEWRRMPRRWSASTLLRPSVMAGATSTWTRAPAFARWALSSTSRMGPALSLRIFSARKDGGSTTRPEPAGAPTGRPSVSTPMSAWTSRSRSATMTASTTTSRDSANAGRGARLTQRQVTASSCLRRIASVVACTTKQPARANAPLALRSTRAPWSASRSCPRLARSPASSMRPLCRASVPRSPTWTSLPIRAFSATRRRCSTQAQASAAASLGRPSRPTTSATTSWRPTALACATGTRSRLCASALLATSRPCIVTSVPRVMLTTALASAGATRSVAWNPRLTTCAATATMRASSSPTVMVVRATMSTSWM